MAENEGVAISFEDATLADTLDVVANLPNRIVFNYCAGHRQLLDVRRLTGMVANGRSRTMADRRCMGHDIDIGT